jgi:hypothetical protein
MLGAYYITKVNLCASWLAGAMLVAFESLGY